LGAIITTMYIDDKTKEQFSIKVIERFKKTKLSFIDCVLELSDEMGIDPIAAGKLLTKPLIEKIQQEAKDLHLIKDKKKNKKLPLD
jgi:hypothetical protein